MAPKCLALATIIAVMAAVTKADNSCAYAWDGACDEGSYCSYGTDSSDCYGGDTCSYAWDGQCDEPAYCAYGTDSTDCRGWSMKKAKLQEDKATTLQNKADLQQAMADALSDRTDQNGAFATAKDDDIKAIGLLESAIQAMSEYGTNNLELLAKKHKKKQPEFEVSKDQAPDAQFSAKDSHKDATTGIISLLTNIKEELEKEVALGTSSEASGQRAYQELRANADKQIEEYDAQVVSLDASIAKTNDQILADNGTKTDKEGEHTTTVEYLGDIAPNCNWIKGAFEKRAAARKVESEGLTQAKSILAGAAGGDFGFLQRVQ